MEEVRSTNLPLQEKENEAKKSDFLFNVSLIRSRSTVVGQNTQHVVSEVHRGVFDI